MKMNLKAANRRARHIIAAMMTLIVTGIGLQGRAQVMDRFGSEKEEQLRKWKPGPVVALGRQGTGKLLWQSSKGLFSLPMVDMDISLEVTGIMVKGEVTQTFQNPTKEVIETLYVFPLPSRAAVNYLEMRIGKRRIISVIKEKSEAKRIYLKARSEGKKAALLEQERPNLFTTSVANINPGERIKVTLKYLVEADYRDGVFGTAIPLTFTPRYIPHKVVKARLGSREPATLKALISDAPRITPPFMKSENEQAPRASIRIQIRPGVPLDGISSASHEILVHKEGETWKVRPRARSVVADRDFLLKWQPKLGLAPKAALLTEERKDGRFVMTLLVPPHPRSKAGRGLATETLFVIDVSGSMAGPSIEQAREALLSALKRIRPGDTFNILKFNHDNQAFREQFQPVNGQTLKAARKWVKELAASGGTQIHPALVRSLAMIGRHSSERVKRIIFLTDGAVGNEAQVFSSVVRKLGKTRLHTIGIGNAPNAYLMRKMAAFGRGLCEFISSTSGAENKITSFFAKIERPIMTDLALKWMGQKPLEVFPRRLPDLYKGEPLLIVAKLPLGRLQGKLVLSGRVQGRSLSTTLDLSAKATRDSGIATRWARAKVESLMDSLHEGAQHGKVREKVISLGKAFNLVTKYTSLVAVEQLLTALGAARTLQLANTLPAGSKLLSNPSLPQGGTSGPLLMLLGLLLTLAGGGLMLFGRAVWAR